MRLEFICQKCGVIVEADGEYGGDLIQCPGCDATIMVPMDVVGSGTIVGGYKVMSKLGTGGMGDVYLAEHTTMQRRVALKVLPPAMTRDRKAAERFMQEVRNQAALNHPNIATAYDAGQDRDIFYLAMEYVEGVDIQRILNRKSHMPERESLRVALEVARGLDYVWYSKQMIHRDVKPANIMISKDADVQLLDMGLSRSMGDMDLSDTNFIIGTPLYMSPEQTDSDAELDFRSDMYSLGSTLYHMLCGQTPYVGKTVTQILAARAFKDPKPIRELNPEVSASAAAVVHKMLARDPSERFPDWATAIAGITQALSGHKNASTGLITGLPVEPTAPAPEATQTPTPKRKPLPRVVPDAPRVAARNPMIPVYLAALGVLALALTAGILALIKLPVRVAEVPTSNPPAIAVVTPDPETAALTNQAQVTPLAPTNLVDQAQELERVRAQLEAERLAGEMEAQQNHIRAEYAQAMEAIKTEPDAYSQHIETMQLLAPRALEAELNELVTTIQTQMDTLQNQRSNRVNKILTDLQTRVDTAIEQEDYPNAISAVKTYEGPLAKETSEARNKIRSTTETRIKQAKNEAKEAERKAQKAYTTLIDQLSNQIVSNQTADLKAHLTEAKGAPDLEPVREKVYALESALNLLNGLDEKILLSFKKDQGKTVEMELPEGRVPFLILDVNAEAVTLVRQVADNGPIVGSVEMRISPRDMSIAERVKRIEDSYGKDAPFVLGFMALNAKREETAKNYFEQVDNDLATVLVRKLEPVIARKNEETKLAAEVQLEREARWAFSSLLHSAKLPADKLATEALLAALDRSSYDESRIRVIRLMSDTYRNKYKETEFAKSYQPFLNRLSNMRYYPIITPEVINRQLAERNPGYTGKGVFEIDQERIVKVDLFDAGSIKDISPLKFLPLRYLRLAGPGIEDLDALKGMPLHTLILSETKVKDLTPLENIPIENLSLKGSEQIRDLKTLETLSLKKLSLAGTRIRKLDALRKLPQLEALDLLDTPVDQIASLAKLPLRVLKFQPGNIKKGLDSLRKIKTLEQIMIDDSGNSLTVQEFWDLQDTAEAPKPEVISEEAEEPSLIP